MSEPADVRWKPATGDSINAAVLFDDGPKVRPRGLHTERNRRKKQRQVLRGKPRRGRKPGRRARLVAFWGIS